MQIDNMRLLHLAVSLGSISKAAAASHISQPALSQQIQRLEQELGFKLLERSNRGVELTAAGEIVEKYADHITNLYDNLMEDLAALRQKRSTFRVAASPVIGIYALPCTMFQLKSEFPQHTFTLTTRPSREVKSMVLQGAADLGLIMGPPKDDSLFYKKVYADQVMLVASSGYNAQDVMTLEQLKTYPLVLTSPQSSQYAQLETYLQGKGLRFDECQVLFQLDSAESVKSSVLEGHGLAFLPYLSIKKELYLKQLRQIELIDCNINYDIYVIYKKKEDNPQTLYTVCTYVTKVVSETFC